MTTHEVEEMLDITKKMLIYYENEGLVKPSRDNNNYRCYNQDDISKIKFILLLREMDVTIEEIKQIINKQKSIRDVLENKKDLIKQRQLDLDHIDEKINNYIKLLFCKWVVIIRLFTMFRAYCISISHSFWRQNCHFYKF